MIDGQSSVAELTRRAEARVLRAGGHWTPPRQRVYELLLTAGHPLKTYELIEQYRAGDPPKPPTVYRALDFLEQIGLVQRVASLSAFLACDGDWSQRPVAVLICDVCEDVRACASHVVGRDQAIGGFVPRVIEVRGRCAACSGRA